jgi:hypothetical protein
MGRILFLTAVAYLAYRYIGRSNKKARELAAGEQEVLPPARAALPAAETHRTGAATEYLPAAKTFRQSRAIVEESYGER